MDKKHKIILIDDEISFANNVKSYFDLHGYECLTASNGHEGLDIIEKEKPRLVILDILMPNMDGYTMLREIKRRKIDIRCIIVTAKGRLKDLFELERVDRFLTKPFDLQKLKDTVDTLLEEDARENPQPEEPQEEKTASESPAGKDLLIVEDDFNLRNNLRRYFELKGYVVREAGSGDEAVKMLREKLPSLVVSDVLMPEMDGYSMVKLLRKTNKDVPIVVISGKDKIKDLMIMEGVDAFLSKPFECKELEKIVDDLLKRS